MMQSFDPVEVFRLIEAERVHNCSLVPAMATALVNCPARGKYDLSSLRRISIGGAASSPTLVREVEEKLGCTCFSGYGLTETAPVLSISPGKSSLCWEGERRFVGQAMTGYAIPGVELRVVDSDDQDVPRDGNSVGEIIARSDGVMEGYWQQPEATTEVLRGGWLHTGDMATWNEDGYLLIVDRKKDIIVSGGENISSLEVEKTLLSHPAVLEAAVIPVPDEMWGEVPKALLVLKPNAQAGEIELIEHCRSRLAHYKCPRSVEYLDSLPRTGTGKVLKRDLRKKYWQGRETIRPEYVAQEAKGTAAEPGGSSGRRGADPQRKTNDLQPVTRKEQENRWI
jgi:fatty-acyl-CoA synthase